MTKDQLAESLYGSDTVYDGVSNEMVEKVVSRLRRKLRELGARGVLETRRGFGYVLNVGGGVDVATMPIAVQDIVALVGDMPAELQAVALAQVQALANIGGQHGEK